MAEAWWCSALDGAPVGAEPELLTDFRDTSSRPRLAHIIPLKLSGVGSDVDEQALLAAYALVLA
eukprot:7377256-Prymnesium_polylepis.1